MSRAPGPAPLYTDAFSLCEWLLGRFGDDPRLLPQCLCHNGIALLEAVTLALKGRRREEQIDVADERLICLRSQIRLATAVGCLTESQALFALERADAIGRQLGGWLRSLGPA